MDCGWLENPLAARWKVRNLGGMKHSTIILSLIFATGISTMASPPSKTGGKTKPAPAAGPAYKEESPLPEGWPAPGPYNQVVRKKYPAYRAAFTTEASPNGGFMKLFKHIQRNNIPMTAPVEMKLDEADTQGTKMEQMAFLYQTPEVGKTGADVEQVEVRDIPAREALSYAWQGARNKESTSKARAEVDAQLEKLGLKAQGYRLLGYNSPFIPRNRQTHELQALLK
jgi:hypothetical protein